MSKHNLISKNELPFSNGILKRYAQIKMLLGIQKLIRKTHTSKS